MKRCIEELESRRLLTVMTAWVNDNWVVSNDVGTVGLSFGDTVENTGAGDDGLIATKTFGVDAFAKIVDALANIRSGGTINILAGTYHESDVVISTPVTLAGVGKNQVRIVPAVASSKSGGAFDTGVHNAFVLDTGNVTIRDLTIDGDGGVGGAGSRNFRAGVIYDYQSPGVVNNIIIEDCAIENILDIGVYLDGGVGSKSSGHLISGNDINNIGGGPQGIGVLLIQASGTISNNTISDDSYGIATNYIDGEAFAPLVTIEGNVLSNNAVGMNLSGLAGGSLIGGTAAQGNSIAMPGDLGIGIVVDYAAGMVTVENNSISGSSSDSAIWPYHNDDPTRSVLVQDNSLTSTASSSDDVSEGAGIFVTTDGSLFADIDAPSHSSLMGNQISGFQNAIMIDGGTAMISGSLPGSPAVVVQEAAQVQLRGSLSLSSLTILSQARVTMIGGGSDVLQTKSLSISADANLDLGQNELILQSDPAGRSAALNGVLALIKNARNTSPVLWQGSGLTSSAAAASAGGTTGLAAILNDRGDGTALYSTFDGAAVDANSVLVKYTYNGDADLNGRDDADDYFQIDSGFTRGAGANPYRNGDFDGNGHVDADDYFLIDRAFVGQGSALAEAAKAKMSRRHRHHWKAVASVI